MIQLQHAASYTPVQFVQSKEVLLKIIYALQPCPADYTCDVGSAGRRGGRGIASKISPGMLCKYATRWTMGCMRLKKQSFTAGEKGGQTKPYWVGSVGHFDEVPLSFNLSETETPRLRICN